MILYSIRLDLIKRPAEERRLALEERLEPFGLALSSFERGKGWRIETIAEERPSSAMIAASLAGLTKAKAKIITLPPKDWVKENEKDLAPIAAGPFFIHGTHFRGRIPKGKKAFVIDAGMAFGTGRHETTKLCLMAINDLSKKGFAPRKILDLGTGTGLLAFAAAHVFQQSVLAADNDKDAVRIAKENALLNDMQRQVRIIRSDGYHSSVLKQRAPFDLILANILANPLIEMAPDLIRCLKPKGIAILSGLTKAQASSVLKAHARLRCLQRRDLKQWTLLILQKK